MRSLSFQRLLGSGAFGSVYLAELAADHGFRRQVAVKVLLQRNTNGDEFVARVRDEARLLGLLADDHILKVLELTTVEERDAVVMEYVEGVDLAALVTAGLRPPPRALAELGAAVAGALHRAHRAVHPSSGEPLNVVHRDVKPGNVMLTARGSVKLLDFGVARARFEARESRTGQLVLGTLNYMAPEYIATGEVSPAADVYGLALTLWEAATGDAFGQPKLRKELHVARVAERLARIEDSHGELTPVLAPMLAWDPRERPDGAAVEAAFIEAADMLLGTGLRAWAAESVPQVLARAYEAARDEAGLVGRTVAIGDAELLAALSQSGEITLSGAPVPAGTRSVPVPTADAQAAPEPTAPPIVPPPPAAPVVSRAPAPPVAPVVSPAPAPPVVAPPQAPSPPPVVAPAPDAAPDAPTAEASPVRRALGVLKVVLLVGCTGMLVLGGIAAFLLARAFL